MAAARALAWLGMLAPLAPRGALAQDPVEHLSCYEAGDGWGCRPCSEWGASYYQDNAAQNTGCKLCAAGYMVELNAQPAVAVAPNGDTTAMSFADKTITVASVNSMLAPGNHVLIQRSGSGDGCNNGAPGAYKIAAIDGNIITLSTSQGGAWAAQLGPWTADPTVPSDCTISRPGPAPIDCQPCGGFVAFDEDPAAFLASSQAWTMPYLGKIDFDQNPLTPCQSCPRASGGYTPLAYTGPAPLPCPLCEIGKTDGDDDPATDCEDCEAGTYSPPGTQCEYCERGKYDHDLDPSTECLLCMPGTVAVTEKSTECEICNAGQYTDEFRMMCKDCPAGWYDHDSSSATDCLECVAGSETVREIAAIVCEECIAGRFSPVNGTVSCSNCDVGRYAPHNAIMCVDCQPGYADMVRDPSVPCEQCQVGDYTDFRALNCTNCAAGTRDDDENPATPCVDCRGGSYSHPGATECIGCEAGTYATLGASSCDLCNAGQYSEEEATACINCDVGQFAAAGSTECTDCSIGQYDNDLSSATPCLPCAIGTYSGSASTECIECLEGQYDHDSDAGTACQLCPRGRYDLRYNSDPFDEPLARTSCTMCAKGKSLDAEGSTTELDCRTCDINTFAEEGFATCTQCPSNLNRRNTYLLTRNRTEQELVESPEYKSGATGMVACVCDEGTFAPRAHVDEDWECTYCPMRESCPGGTADSPRGTCILGYGGEWCQSCDRGYFKFEVECIECPPGAIFRIAIFIAMLLFFVTVMIRLAKAARENDLAGGNNLFRAAITPAVIVLNRGQIFGAITNLDADWPNFVRKAAFLILHLANVDLPSIVYPECQIDFDSAGGVLLFRIVFNAVLYLIVCLFVFMVFLVYSCKKWDISPLINGVVGAFCVLFILLVRVAFKTFDCTHNRDGNWYMDLNPDVLCWQGEFWAISGVGLGMLFIYLGLIPFLLWWQLPYGDLGDSDTVKKFGWLYARYRPSCYYFEWILMLQKVLIAAATTFVSSRKRVGLSCTFCLLITLASLAVQLKLMPYSEWQLKEATPKPKPISLDSIGEESAVGLPKAKAPKLRCCRRPPPPSRYELLESDWRPWKWFGLSATIVGDPPAVPLHPETTKEVFLTLLKRWGHAFSYPISLNSLEIIGLTVQLFAICTALYFCYGAAQSGDCTLDGFEPTEVGFPAAATEEACLELTSAAGSSGIWTKTEAVGGPKNVGIVTLVAPSCFVFLALVYIVINTRAYFKQRRAEREARRRMLAQENFKSAGANILSMVKGIGAWKGFKREDPLVGRPSSAQPKPGEMSAVEKVNAFLHHQGPGALNRRNSTPTGEPKNLNLETIDLLTAYPLSEPMQREYRDEVQVLLGNKGSKGSAGKITQMQLGRGTGIDQLMPDDQKRLLFLQWRLAEDRIIRDERTRLEDERFGVDVEQEEEEEEEFDSDDEDAPKKQPKIDFSAFSEKAKEKKEQEKKPKRAWFKRKGKDDTEEIEEEREAEPAKGKDKDKKKKKKMSKKQRQEMDNSVKKMIFVLKFIAKTYGPMARNRRMFEQEIKQAQRRTRRSQKKFRKAASLVQSTTRSGKALSSLTRGQTEGTGAMAWEEGAEGKEKRKKRQEKRKKKKKGEPSERTDREGGEEKERKKKKKKNRDRSRREEEFEGVAPQAPPGLVP